MKINWALRLKNKVVLVSLVALIVGFVYQVCGVFEVVPPISQDEVTQGIGILINVLVAMGVVADPTTKGVGDSQAAMAYKKPRDDKDHVAPEVQ